MPIAASGQITIVDQTDSRTLSVALFCPTGTQQVFSKDNDTTQFKADWFASPLKIRAQVWASGTSTSTDVTRALSNRKFVTEVGGTALETTTTSKLFSNSANVDVSTPFSQVNHTDTESSMYVKGNLKDGSGDFTVYFEADYTDPATRQTTHIVSQPITLTVVKTGTNAVHVLTRGALTIKQSLTSTKSCTAITADLMRSSTPGDLSKDTTNLSYKWFEADTGTQITSAMAGVSTKYGLKSHTANALVAGAVGDLNVNLPSSGAASVHNTLVISEAAVTNVKVYRVEITDTVEGKTYTGHFTIQDASDPITIDVVSSGGDRLSNGVGSTTLTPRVKSGGTTMTQVELTGWTFTWEFYDTSSVTGEPKKAAFVNKTVTAQAGGRNITANGTGASATITYAGTVFSGVAAGSIIKCVHPKTGVAAYYEVASMASNALTIRTPTTNAFLSFANFPAPTTANELNGGKLFVCTPSITSATLDLDGDDIDVKGTIMVVASRP